MIYQIFNLYYDLMKIAKFPSPNIVTAAWANIVTTGWASLIYISPIQMLPKKRKLYPTPLHLYLHPNNFLKISILPLLLYNLLHINFSSSFSTSSNSGWVHPHMIFFQVLISFFLTIKGFRKYFETLNIPFRNYFGTLIYIRFRK